MTREQYLKEISEFFAKLQNIIETKSSDYSQESDPFSNFRAAELFGVTLEQGILVRMSDKMGRVGNLLNKGTPAVQSEKIEDTLLDLAGYTVILATRIKNKNATRQN